MRFVRIKGVEGLVFEPDGAEAPRKHRCPDCHSCQWCGDDRCRTCLSLRRTRQADEKGRTACNRSGCTRKHCSGKRQDKGGMQP